jgi:thiamine kinase-like enzyme
MVSCHSDPKPENILFDGQRVWLVDWHAAIVNDRYFDLLSGDIMIACSRLKSTLS